jgi:conjugal transfer/entry exclusion protein
MSSAVPDYGETHRPDAADRRHVAGSGVDGQGADDRQALLEDTVATSRDAQATLGALGERVNVKHRAREGMQAGEQLLARRAGQLAPARRRLVAAAGQARQRRVTLAVGAGAAAASGVLVWMLARRN